MSKKYSIRGKISKKAEEELSGQNVLTAQLLYNRGIKTKKEAEIFLAPDFVNHLHDPFLLPDMKKAVDRILLAILNNERVGIWSDYDADGIPGGALLHDFFKLVGFNNFINYIPDRHIEGYGLNSEGLEELAKDKVKLLISVDCGIRDHKEILHAKKLGMEVIITDHHEQSDGLPKAYAVINPKRKDSKYPEQILCGTGVIWKLIEALLQTKRDFIKDGQPFELPQGKEKWLLDLVGLATLSDMVPLTGENRVLAHFGLSVLRKSRRPGLQRLLSNLKINKDNITEDDISFMVTPRINAASRMGHPRDAFKLLTVLDLTEADICAKHLDNINNERKGVVASMVKEANKKIKEKFENEGEKQLIVLGNPDWKPSLLGLVANSIADEYNRPVFLWGRASTEVSTSGVGDVFKGSCRSDGTTNLVSLMERAKDSFIEFGGHKLSGGFSVLFEKIHTLEDALVEASTHIVNGDLEILVDAELKLENITEKSVNEILKLAPFGVGNEKPLFIFRDILPEKINRFGKAKEHLSINLRDGSSSIRAISFFASPDQFGDALKEGIKTNLVASVEKSDFGGRREIRLRIVDFFIC
ncbi:MAG: single-stranded-DNA-specific exonuclease RecJ [Candidatus Zambryskibacteria bacterium RIFCSPLOWO2_01_FULL_39_39]|uniref:Single-stranded-DNA-specific exonuclease RecJ n=1 Tax=Candidatus Zambryskibacteria bacterium RIFCSPLOWO2_01_FULL_39_39 TaxID=1802758 RepID=A0A1G2TXK7_9BACT|nr:MAG: single-stranded-DNA-specific exonuclease RecJ [Candidatus Zambryskibacteria bacterium RIFCSPHIGHO2_01_FULL_39_63]OHA95127.1 MAG: single-stranded-DNA-specific exonuclease RecJ [Candidatus Zambryskibacteria bacterium RIFCSPHIGHO2_02_FULL_39_19]OHA98661.1 MAG: single-stranded-DNA-specific exonuclease RecJ [Candidatus Zambryskibacteria bacterium RIFCSPHIGHO2_12_FULL_39_21]OHB02035.1 MAG: single-stranded-DNA-specific exonuclease RecJ [Candidatus Zambryskibacteria bacterium RIFCSPLOWO2_01_FULL